MDEENSVNTEVVEEEEEEEESLFNFGSYKPNYDTTVEVDQDRNKSIFNEDDNDFNEEITNIESDETIITRETNKEQYLKGLAEGKLDTKTHSNLFAIEYAPEHLRGKMHWRNTAGDFLRMIDRAGMGVAQNLVNTGQNVLRGDMPATMAEVLSGDQANEVLNLLKNDAERTYENYETMLNERYDGSVVDEKETGLARELARMNLTLNTYTQWYWKTDLLNLMNFLRLRADHHAQYEIRAYADVMLDTLKRWVPTTYEAFMDYRVGGTEVSSKGKKIIKNLISGEKVDSEQSGLSKREWNELMLAFDLKDKLI